jgi:hypothetical protein
MHIPLNCVQGFHFWSIHGTSNRMSTEWLENFYFVPYSVFLILVSLFSLIILFPTSFYASISGIHMQFHNVIANVPILSCSLNTISDAVTIVVPLLVK